jgi:hypothetical protein
LCALAGLLVGGLLGGFLTYSAKPLLELPNAECAAASNEAEGARGGRPRLADDRLRALLADSLGFNLETAMRIGSLERLLRELGQYEARPSQLIAGLVEHMNEGELYSLLYDLTSLHRSHLQDVEDVRRFASRLAEVALSGTFEPLDEAKPANTSEVLFSTERELVDPAAVASTRFSSDVSVIHAIFPVGELENTHAVLKWIRLDPAQIVTIRRLGLYSQGEAYFSYGIRRSDALQPGPYRVALYHADDELTPIASGSYEVE